MNAIELLTQDHRKVEKLFADFEADPGDDRHEILARIIRELSIHAAIEEAYLYPRVRREIPITGPHVEDGVHDHQEMKESMARLDGRLASAHTREVADLVATLKKKTADHVAEEETELFPAFAMVARKRDLEEVGRVMEKAKSTAPTRPHPRQPAVNEFTMRANGIVDRARDAVAGRAR
jgi:hemerythrin superfamily protein